MNPDLASFLKPHQFRLESKDIWGNGKFPLRIHHYLSDQQPPLPYVTSVRCVLFRNTEVLVMRNPSDTHLTPGGRIEAGEALREALNRELLEETGWTIHTPIQIGFMHLHHLAPKPPDFHYIYPDFVQIVYAAQVHTHHPEARDENDYELESFFHPISEIESLNLQPRHLLYLTAAQQALI